MGDGSGPSTSPVEGDGEGIRILPGREAVTQPRSANPVQSSHEPVTYIPPRQPAAASGSAPPTSPPPSELVRHGPGVPGTTAASEVAAVSAAGVAAESVWRTGRRTGPAPRSIQFRRIRRVLGSVLTVLLLLAAAVIVYLRFFDHPPLKVSSVAIKQVTHSGCAVDVTGQIATNGAAGTVHYQWVFQPQTQAPQPLAQSVVSGQHDIYVTVSVQGKGHGSATESVKLDLLGPGTGTASTNVALSC
jgi:hypothetical protein